MVKEIPKLLIGYRLLISFGFLGISPSSDITTIVVVLALLYSGIISDIFDGIVARSHNIATTNLRVYDTIVDLIFYLSVFFYLYRFDDQSFKTNGDLILMIFCLEACMYGVSLARFRRLPSPHALLSKTWGVCLVVESTLLILKVPGIHFRIALFFGIIAHLDRVLIYCLIKDWEKDIPSSYHALQLRWGKEIKRNSLFN